MVIGQKVVRVVFPEGALLWMQIVMLLAYLEHKRRLSGNIIPGLAFLSDKCLGTL